MAKRNKKRNRRHDAAFKSLHALPLMAWGLMEIVLPRALFEELDFGTLERLPAEWVGPGLERLSPLLGGPAHRGLRLAFAEWIWHSLAPGLGPESPRVPGLRARLLEIAELGEFEEMKSFMLKSMVDHWLEQGVAQGMERGVSEGVARAPAVSGPPRTPPPRGGARGRRRTPAPS